REQVLAADRPAGLSRGPRRVCAPVRALAASCRERGGETRVAVGDLEVADHGVLDRRDLPDLVDTRGRWFAGVHGSVTVTRRMLRRSAMRLTTQTATSVYAQPRRTSKR